MDFTKRNPRRTFLRLVGGATVGSLAGCISNGGAGDTGTGGSETATGGTGTDEGGGTETTAPDPQREPSEQPTSTEPRGTGTVPETNTGEASASGTPALSGPIPAVYRTATSQGGTERNPDSLQSKDAVQYQSHPKNGQQCSGCMFYIPDKNGDGLGACSVVEGFIQPQGWCVSYSPYHK
jgi:hypothetical protein